MANIDRKTAALLNSIMQNASTEFRNVVTPIMEQDSAERLTGVFNGDGAMFSELLTGLSKMITRTKFANKNYRNTLKRFHKGKLDYGAIIRTVYIHDNGTYKYNAEQMKQSLLSSFKPHISAYFSTVVKDTVWPVEFNEYLAPEVFSTQDGLMDYVAAHIESATTQDEEAEYLYTKQTLINAVVENKIVVKPSNYTFADFDGEGTPAHDAGTWLLKRLQIYADRFKQRSRFYNTVDAKTNTTPGARLVLITSPEVKACLNVDALATLFHLEKAETDAAIEVVDYLDSRNDIIAILCDGDILSVYDAAGNPRFTNFFNDADLTNTVRLFHREMFEFNPFVNALAFVDPSVIPVLNDASYNLPNISIQRGSSGVILPTTDVTFSGVPTKLVLTGNNSPDTQVYGRYVSVSINETSTALSLTLCRTDVLQANGAPTPISNTATITVTAI